MDFGVDEDRLINQLWTNPAKWVSTWAVIGNDLSPIWVPRFYLLQRNLIENKKKIFKKIYS